MKLMDRVKAGEELGLTLEGFYVAEDVFARIKKEMDPSLTPAGCPTMSALAALVGLPTSLVFEPTPLLPPGHIAPKWKQTLQRIQPFTFGGDAAPEPLKVCLCSELTIGGTISRAKHSHCPVHA